MKVRVKVPGTCGELVQGIKEQNTKLIGEGATISTLANQRVLFNRYLDYVISISKRHGSVRSKCSSQWYSDWCLTSS